MYVPIRKPKLRIPTFVIWIVPVALALFISGHRLRLSESNPDHLRFAHTFTTASEREIVDAAIAEFEAAHPPIKIEQTVSNSEIYQTIGWRLQFQGRNQPDVYFYWEGFKADYAIEKGWAMDMSPFLDERFMAELLPSAVKRKNGGVFFLPQSMDLCNLVWYNKSAFTQIGAEEPETLSDWLDLCLKLRDVKMLPLAQGNRDLWPIGNFGAELLGQSLGGENIGELFLSGRPIVQSESMGLEPLSYLERNRCFELPGVLERGAVGALWDIDAKIVFLSGKAAQHIVGSWFLADIQDAKAKGEFEFDVGVFPVPARREELDAAVAATTGFLVNPTSANPKLAVKFIELLLSRKYQSQFARIGNLSLRRDAADFTTEPLARRLLDIAANTPVFVPPPDSGWQPEQAQLFYEICGKIVSAKLPFNQVADYWTRGKEKLARKGL